MTVTWSPVNSFPRWILFTSCISAFAGCGQPAPPPQGSLSSAPAAMPAPVDQAEVSIPPGPDTKRPLREATPEELDQLLAAAGQAEEERVTQLVNDGVNINQQNAEGETALMRAAMGGHNGFVEILLSKYKADPKLQNKAGKTAEQLAREKGHDGTADAIAKHQQ